MEERQIDPERVPRHVAIVMDGNGRWATKRDLPRTEGHHAGYKRVRPTVQAALDLGIQVLTLYTFSTENWRRPKEETDAIMRLIAAAARNDIGDMKEQGVKVIVSGRFAELPEDVREELGRDRDITKGNNRLVLNLAINYGGRREIADAARTIAERVACGAITPDDIDEQLFSQFLYAPDIPDPDLLIRTAGEMRVSNFLLWEIAYSEIHVTDVLWPDFMEEDLKKAVLDYQSRTRKFGGTKNNEK